MPAKIEQYRADLKEKADWLPYLMANSGLPGPRGNLELAQAVAELATRAQLDALLAVDESNPTENTPETYVVFCGIKGLGKYAEDDPAARLILRRYASDPRWRIREAAAMGLQLWGEHHIQSVIDELRTWPLTNPLEMRAIAAALCEPILLKNDRVAAATLDILDQITTAFTTFSSRTAVDIRTLRQGLAYCWSVAVVAFPQKGKPLMEKWAASPDKDIQWMMAENLKKNRLIKMDQSWVSETSQKIRK